MDGMTLVGLTTTFIAMAIMLGIGTAILGSAVTDCTNLTGWQQGSATQNNQTLADTDADRHTGWAKQCVNNNSNAQSGYGLMMITLIVLAAVVILVVVRQLG